MKQPKSRNWTFASHTTDSRVIMPCHNAHHHRRSVWR